MVKYCVKNREMKCR